MSGRSVRVAFTLDPSREAGGGSYSFARLMARHLPTFGVTVTHTPWRPCDAVLVFANVGSRPMLRFRRWRGTRIVHRLDERIDPHEDAARARKHAHLLALNALADVSVFQSRFVATNVGPRTTAPRSIVIHNGVDTSRFAPTGSRRMLDGTPRILHASWSVGSSKRLDRLDELVRVLPSDARVYLAGRHREAPGTRSGDPRVTYLGPQDSDAMAVLMRSVDALFFPSEDDPCPNTILEAMASGLPALYHPSGGTPELVGDAGVPLTGDLAADVDRLLTSRPTLARLGRERACTEFSAERVAERYARVLTGTEP